MNGTLEDINELQKNKRIGFIRSEDYIYEKCKDIIVKALKEKELIPFFGAGISIDYPSCVPSTDKINKNIKRVLWDSFKGIIPKDIWLKHKIELIKIARLLLNTRMERLFDILYKAYGMSGLEGIYALDGSIPNFNHECIAVLSKKGYLENCITLNFDILIERAVNNYQTICPLYNNEPIFEEKENNKNVLSIIKPHGSFEKYGENQERLKYVHVTISQAGDTERKENIETIHKILSKSKVLLVAGYSDNDWDIFPILQDYLYDHPGFRLIWIQHENNNNVSLSKDNSLKHIDKVLKWYTHRKNNEHIILIGNVSVLLKEILVELKLEIPHNSNRQNDKWDDWADRIIERYITSLKSNPSKLLLGFCYLLGCQTERFFQRIVLLKLLKEAKNNQDTKLLINCYWALAGTYHMESRYKRSVIFGKHALKLEEGNKVSDYIKMSDKYMSLGYDYFCLCKRPKFSPKGLCLFFLNIWIGKRYMKKAVKFEILDNKINNYKREKTFIRERTSYYKVDLYHTWSNLLLFLGPQASLLIKWIYCWIDHKYNKIFSKYPNLEYTEYYWMRAIEAKILSKRIKRYGSNLELVNKKLDKIEDSCKLTYKQIHLGNVYLYRGLLKESKNDILNSIDKAEKHWSGVIDTDNRIHTGYKKFWSGLRHVVLFKRYYGFLTFKRAVKEFRGYTNV